MRTYIGVARPIAHQSVAYTTSAAGTIATAPPAGVEKVRLMVTTDSFVNLQSVTATTADMYLPALFPEYFSVTQGQGISAIGVAAAGTLHMTWVS